MSRLVFDPELIPQDVMTTEVSVDPARLNLSWIRQRFAAPPLWQPEISTESSLFPPGQEFTDASVLIALVQRPGGLTLLLTRRTAHLTHHAGQISFPGGRAEASDSSPIATALRESHEEVGLQREHVEVLGTLPPYFTGTGYRVTPVVAAVEVLPQLVSQANEVAEIFEVPLAHLMDASQHQRRTALLQGVARSFYAMPYQDYFIWGATAGMLRNLFHFLRA